MNGASSKDFVHSRDDGLRDHNIHFQDEIAALRAPDGPAEQLKRLREENAKLLKESSSWELVVQRMNDEKKTMETTLKALQAEQSKEKVKSAELRKLEKANAELTEEVTSLRSVKTVLEEEGRKAIQRVRELQQEQKAMVHSPFPSLNDIICAFLIGAVEEGTAGLALAGGGVNGGAAEAGEGGPPALGGARDDRGGTASQLLR